jgi:hypothetical protein
MGEQSNVTLRGFSWLCLKEAAHLSWDKSDYISGVAGFVLAAIAFFVPVWEERLTHSLLIVPLVAFAVVMIVRLFLSPFLVYRNRDIEARINEEQLSKQISDRDQTIRTLTEKPRRTAAEQHHYDIAKKALQKLSPDTVSALRHLKTQGKLTFGTFPPSLPSGISVSRLVDIYLECSREGLVATHDDSQKGERTFTIAPTMNSVLDELLYEEKGLSGLTSIRRADLDEPSR